MPETTSTMNGNPSKEERVTVKYEGGVYDLTQFLADHPGGSDLIQQYSGQDISRVFNDPDSHKHSNFAHSLLKRFRIDDAKRGKGSDKKNGMAEFLDLERPLIAQMWNLKISKKDYLREVHLPRHLGRSARFFESDYLERLTKTPWWFIPLFWGPILLTCGYIGGSRLLAQGLSPQSLAVLWTSGLVMWTVLEYTFHRFLFHMTDWLPEHPIAFTIHFLFHGVHHFLPMDKYRLVMPPVMFGFFTTVVYSAASLLIPQAHLLFLISGILVGYITYDMMHYFFHHGGMPFIPHVAMMKTYHMDHHYVNENLGFGVSTKVWDTVLGTELPPHKSL